MIYKQNVQIEIKMRKKYTISVFTEHQTALLTRVTFVFTRRKINMESVTAFESGYKGVYKYTFVVNETEETVRKVTQQIEKQVDIHRAVYHQEFDELAFLNANQDKKELINK
jgi:acetolactate synthase-1/3 small subunit